MESGSGVKWVFVLAHCLILERGACKPYDFKSRSLLPIHLSGDLESCLGMETGLMGDIVTSCLQIGPRGPELEGAT